MRDMAKRCRERESDQIPMRELEEVMMGSRAKGGVRSGREIEGSTER